MLAARLRLLLLAVSIFLALAHEHHGHHGGPRRELHKVEGQRRGHHLVSQHHHLRKDAQEEDDDDDTDDQELRELQLKVSQYPAEEDDAEESDNELDEDDHFKIRVGLIGAPPSNDTEVLKPSCETIWKKEFKDKKKVKAFKHPSTNPLHKEVYCVPLKWVRFSQESMYSVTTGGHPLSYWIEKFKKHGYYKKVKLPDFVRWRKHYYQTVDNRRIYSAKQAGLVFVPARVHQFYDPLPTVQLNRFRVNVTGMFFNGQRRAGTWGEGVALRGVDQPSGLYPMFGSLDLPKVYDEPTITVVNKDKPSEDSSVNAVPDLVLSARKAMSEEPKAVPTVVLV